MGLSSLKVVHPYGKWAFSALMLAIAGLYLAIAGANPRITEQGVEVTLDQVFTLGIVLYIASSLVFLYLKLSARIRRLPAGEANLQALSQFIARYPDISKEHDLERLCVKETTYGQLKDIQKVVNRSLVRLASRTIMRKGRA